MKAAVASVNDFLIILRKALRVSSMSEALNFFCLFMMFRMSFLIICESDSITCSYSKLFILLRSVCDFFRKKLHHSMSAFFCVVRVMHHLRQLLSSAVISEQQCDSSDVLP